MPLQRKDRASKKGGTITEHEEQEYLEKLAKEQAAKKAGAYPTLATCKCPRKACPPAVADSWPGFVSVRCSAAESHAGAHKVDSDPVLLARQSAKRSELRLLFRMYASCSRPR